MQLLEYVHIYGDNAGNDKGFRPWLWTCAPPEWLKQFPRRVCKFFVFRA